jgi:hypothetical protein
MTDRSSMATYVCGPMSGVDQFNIPLFDAVAENLRALGRKVVSPAELDSAEMRKFALQSKTGNMAELTQQLVDAGFPRETWGDVLARDVRLIEHEIGAFVLLPNWRKSRGAKLEVFVGLLCGISQFEQAAYDNNGALGYWPATVDQIRQAIRENMP